MSRLGWSNQKLQSAGENISLRNVFFISNSVRHGMMNSQRKLPNNAVSFSSAERFGAFQYIFYVIHSAM